MNATRFVVAAVTLLAAVDALAFSDLDLVEANLGRESGADNPVTILHPQLQMSPGRKTLLQGESLRVAAAGATNAITWFVLDNPSGGAFVEDGSNAIVYVTGPTSACVDVVEAWDGGNSFGRTYLNVISTNDVAAAGKAIILAGTKGTGDPLWTTTDYLADNAYNVFLYRGYSKANVQYLSPVIPQDVDGDGAADDVDAATTYANTRSTFTTWVTQTRTDKLFVYCVDHGGKTVEDGYFRLNSNEELPATQLDTWLDELQDRQHTDVTVLIDCCYAGSLLSSLTYTGTARRVVMAACGSDEPAYFVAGGLVSFSDAFFGGIMQGRDVMQSYGDAAAAMSLYQQSLYADNQGGGAANGQFVGATFVAGKDIPQIGTVCGNQLLTGESAATLWADDIASDYTIDRVWCLVIPPGHNPTNAADPVSDVPEIDLAYDTSKGRYEGVYDGFSGEGTYKVIYYARDSWNSVSPPVQSYVIQSDFDERVILLAGGSTNAPAWASIDGMARYAYHTFQARWLTSTNIQYLSNVPYEDLDLDGSNDVDAACTLTAIGHSITNWAANANRVTLYAMADGSSAGLRLNETETLASATLDGWLDRLQVSNCEVCVVLECPESGSFLNALRPSPDQTRICLASTAAGGAVCWRNNGLASFSWCFLSRIFAGASVGEAFAHAASNIRGLSRRQRPELDDDGDGAYGGSDGLLARRTYIGTAFRTGAESPVIAEVGPAGTYTLARGLTVWASGITDMSGISNVWCLVTRPDYDGAADLPRVDLTWNEETQRYEAWYDGFTVSGTNVCTFYAMDAAGEISVPVQAELVGGADAYEPDDTPERASYHNGATQEHTLHVSNDVDWVMFYAATNVHAYTIVATNATPGTPLRLALYRQALDGTLIPVDTISSDPATGIAEVSVNFVTQGDEPGFYFVEVQAASGGAWAPIDYKLTLTADIGGGGILLAVVLDRLTGAPPPGAVLTLTAPGGGDTVVALGSAPSVSFASLDAGLYTLSVTVPAGFMPEEDPKTARAPSDPHSSYGNPQLVKMADDAFVGAIFRFIPMLRAEGLVRDAWTGERVGGAALAFTAASGPRAGDRCTAYPNNATYAAPWLTSSDGAFPTNVLLHTARWDVRVSASNYADLARAEAVSDAGAGAVVPIGTLWLTPLDANSNRLADAWEARHGGALDPALDPDHDGHNTLKEYLAGTDPTNGASVLALERPLMTATGVLLRWPVAPGRTYSPEAGPAAASGEAWTPIAPPREAATNMSHMQALDTNAPPHAPRFYRIGVRSNTDAK